MPSFSVVIAAYQAAETVGEAIESALAQTLPALEVIVVDDGSSDGTAAALEPYAPKIRSLRQDHRGVASAWNAALEVARADFFAVLGAEAIDVEAFALLRAVALRGAVPRGRDGRGL